jgi:signal transduction histidine kinase
LDEKLLWHLLNNLLTNAIKYSPEGGIVSLTLTLLGEPSDEQTDEQICFTIRDQGIGMPVDYLDHLFEPFQRAKNVGKIEGTGLGLAIVKRSVDLHGGSISVDSAVNQGTEFTIKLPRHADSQTAIASVRPFQTT